MAHFAIAGNPIAAAPLANGLYLVATPIGNLGDVTLRALATLAAADLVACEDTRITARLLRHYAIRTPMTAYHEHNADKAGAMLLDRLSSGATVALASDAGSPLISDPGQRLVEAARKRGIAVMPVPGASAPIAALTASALPTASFFFGGFLPPKVKARQDRLRQLAAVPATLMFFESPNRLAAALQDIGQVLGDRPTCVAREMTKIHEEFRSGTAAELADHYQRAGAKGEVVILIGPALAAESAVDIDSLLDGLLKQESVSRAAAIAARQSGVARKVLYARALELAAGKR